MQATSTRYVIRWDDGDRQWERETGLTALASMAKDDPQATVVPIDE